MTLFSRVVLAIAGSQPVERMVTGTSAGRALASRFVGGETLKEAASVAADLNLGGMSVSLDLLGEEVSTRQEVDRALRGYLEVLDQISSEDLDANISIKLSQLGLAIDESLAVASLERLAAEARRHGTTVTIDMEGSRYTARTVEIYADVQARYGNLGICLQAYLHRTPSDLERLMGLGGHIRLCKGAYREPAAIAFQTADDVDAAFARLLMVLMANDGVRPAIATHDPRLIRLAEQLAERRSGGFEFQMLHGIRRDEQHRLAGAGHDVRIYVPFGSAWYPYLTRRLAERPANVLFLIRALGPSASEPAPH